MWQQLVRLWNQFLSDSEESEYFEWCQRYPDQALFIENKTKAELLQELYEWKIRSSEQAETILRLESRLKNQEKFFRGKIKKHYKQTLR